jgi:hypothetical protein
MFVDFQPVALEELRHREDRPDAHFLRLTAGNRNAAVIAQNVEVAALGELGIHDDTGRSAIRKLAGVAGSDILAVAAHRNESREPLECRIRSIAFVRCQAYVGSAAFAGILVDDDLRRWQRHDFRLETSTLLRGGGTALALAGELVLRVAANLVTLCHEVRGLDHRPVDLGLIGDKPVLRFAVMI